MSSQEHVLYVVPVVPSANGSGIARRAFHTLQSLATTSQVHVRWVDAFGVMSGHVVEEAVLALCASFEPIRPTRMQRGTTAVLRALRHRLPTQFARWWRDPFDFACARRLGGTLRGHRSPLHCRRVVLFRLYLYPVASALLETMPGARLYIDLDDIESVTRQRIGGLYRARGERGMAAILDAESQFYHELEARVLPSCDGVFVASAVDRDRLAGTLDVHRLAVLPNVYPAAPPREAMRATAPGTVLVSGAFGYFPNHDAAMWLCREVIPLVVAGMQGAVRFRFVGAMARRELQDTIAATAHAVYEGPVPDVGVAYREVDVAVVPIRGGGGTRIKLLEAFARGIPVVSTTVGAEGIAVDDEVHLLLADSPDAFAAQCLRFAQSACLRESLAAAAMARWSTHYRPAAIAGTITDLFERT